MARVAAVFLIVIFPGACGVVPSHDIKPTPAFVQAGVQPGDRVEILTRDGRKHVVVVTEVTESEIRSADETVTITSIISLKKSF